MRKKYYLYLLIITGILIGSIYYFTSNRSDEPKISNNKIETVVPKTDIKAGFKNFSPQQFEELYNNFAYPNTQLITNNYSITGNSEADKIIYSLAESSGYKIRSAPITDNLISVNADHTLQQKAAVAWQNLRNNAKKDGINLEVVEGYRSADDQAEIFKSRLGNISESSITSRTADNAVLKVLKTTAPPGYSRHHSGYTIDLKCINQPGQKFEDSVCFDWISKGNYLNAKKSGWIPSYPEGIKNQGPDPEAWEYVWVGTDSLRE